MEDFHVPRSRGRFVAACQPDVVSAVGIGWEIAPSVHEWLTRCPAIATWIVDVHLIRGIGRDSPAAHHIHLVAELKPACLSRGPWYGRDRADGIGGRVEAEGVSGVNHRATREIRCPCQVD